MSDTPLIYAKIAAIIADLGAIEKSKDNREQGFKYRGIDQVYNAIHPLFAKHGIFTVPEVQDRNQLEHVTKSGAAWKHVILRVKYTYYASDGSHVESIVFGEGLDNSDKATNKAMAVAHKYSLLQMFCVATEDMDDPDATTPPEADARKSAPKSAPAAAAIHAPAGNGHDGAAKKFQDDFTARWKWFKSFHAEHHVMNILGTAGYEKASEIPADKRASFLKALDDAKSYVQAEQAAKVPGIDNAPKPTEDAEIDAPVTAEQQLEFEESKI